MGLLSALGHRPSLKSWNVAELAESMCCGAVGKRSEKSRTATRTGDLSQDHCTINAILLFGYVHSEFYLTPDPCFQSSPRAKSLP